MIIKSISAENFGKFDRYSVNLDDNINVFFGDNEAGKTTLYEIISILLFAPTTEQEIEQSNRLIKSDEKYARVYAIINMDGKEISIAREIYVNDTNLSIADQENVSSLGNVNVPFIGDLSKEMYESFHTIDYYNMATITKNVWEQIVKVIEESHGAPRKTPDYSTPEEEKPAEKQKATFEDQIEEKEKEKKQLEKDLKDAQKKQKRMIKNQDKIDDLYSDLEDIENNIELESAYLKEAGKMNQIRNTIKKTQDLALELEQYKNLKPWMPNLRDYYERLKLYTENKANGIENPLDMFDDLEEDPKPKKETSKPEEKKEAVEGKKEEEPKQETVEEELLVIEEAETEVKPATEETAVEEEEKPPVAEEAIAKEKPPVIEEIKFAEQPVDEYKAEIEEIQPAAEETKAEELPPIVEEIMSEVKKQAFDQIKAEEAAIEEKIPAAEETKAEEKVSEIIEEKPDKPETDKPSTFDLSADEEYDATNSKINKFIEESYLSSDEKEETEEDSYVASETAEEMLNVATSRFISANMPETEKPDESEKENDIDDITEETKDIDEGEEVPVEVKPLEIRKPKSAVTQEDDLEERGIMNRFGQTNPYSDNILPDMDKVNYFGKDLSNLKVNKDDDEDDGKYSLSTSNDLPTQSKTVLEEAMEYDREKSKGEQLLEAEQVLNNIDMQEVIAASKEKVEVDAQTKEEIDKAQLRFKVIAKRVFGKDMDMEDLTHKLKALDTNLIYKSIVKYKGLAQKHRKMELDAPAPKAAKEKSTNGSSIALGVIAILSMLLGLSCFFIDQIIAQFPGIGVLNVIYQVVMELPLNDVVAGNILAGGAFVLIAILLTVAIILGSEKSEATEQIEFDDVEIDDLKNSIRMAKREVIDSLKGFPLPNSYLDNPNNSIITVINELREAETAYNDIVMESSMPNNKNYRDLWKLTKKHLSKDEFSDDLFDNISRLRRKIQDYKEDIAAKEKKLKEAKDMINLVAGTPSFSNTADTGSANSTPSFGSAPTAQNNVSARSSFGLPQPDIHKDEAPNNESIKNVSESTSFDLPTANVSSTENTGFGISDKSNDITLNMSKDQHEDTGFSDNGNVFGNQEDKTYPESSNTFNSAMDTSYPENGGMYGEVKDDTYPGNKTETESVPFGFSQSKNEQPQMDNAADNPFGAAMDNNMSSDDNPFGIPADSNNAGNDNPFGIPADSNNVGNDNPFGIPADSNNAGDDNPFGIPADSNNAGNDNPFGIPADSNHINNDNPFSAPTDTSQQNNDNPFSASSDTPVHDNPFGEGSFGNHDAGIKTETDDFGIPGIRHYSGTEASENTQHNPFAAPKTEGNGFAQTGQSEEGNGFDIPGVKRYTSGVPSMQESAENDPFNIPGIKRYTGVESKNEEAINNTFEVNAPANNKVNEFSPQTPKAEDDNPYGIPGIKRYTYEEPVKEPEKNVDMHSEPVMPEVSDAVTAFNPIPEDKEVQADAVHEEPKMGGFPSGLPGLDKFSNRGEQLHKKPAMPKMDTALEKPIEDEMPVVPPVVNPTEKAVETAVGAAAGAFALSGLPGLDKFSNRAQQPKESKPIESEKPVEEEKASDEVHELPIEADPFGIPEMKMTEVHTEKIAETKAVKEPETKVETAEAAEEPIAEEKTAEVETTAEIKPAEEIKPEPEIVEEPESEPEPEEIPVVEVKKDRREKEYDKLLEILGSNPEGTIREIEDLARSLHREITKRDEAMGDLLKLNDAAVRLSTLSSNKWPYKQKAVDASRERIDFLEADKLKMQRHLEMMENKIKEVPYEETPQAISDRLKVVEEEIEQLKLESDKHALAEELIEKQKLLDMSSSEDRSHIIEDTSVYMKELTLGKYVEVKINEEQTGLAICDKDGQWFDTTKDRLSQATREQLYLALRISIADLFDEKSLIFPMFFDEALITWDKRRMKAVMRLLSKMSMHRQVIIFTCHDWLKDMISDYLIGAKIILM